MKNVFLSAGGGCQFYQMGWELYQNYPVFQSIIKELNHLDIVGISIVDCIFDKSKRPTDISTPLHFTISSNQKGIERIKKFLTQQDIDYLGIPVPYGVHSRFYQVDDNLKKALELFQMKPPTLTRKTN